MSRPSTYPAVPTMPDPDHEPEADPGPDEGRPGPPLEPPAKGDFLADEIGALDAMRPRPTPPPEIRPPPDLSASE